VLNWLKNPDYGFSDESSNDDLAADNVQHALEATWGKIEEQKEIKRRNQFLNFEKRWFNGVAAVLIISLLTGWLYNQSNTSENAALTYSELINENDEGLVEQTNNSDKPQIITLSDGSSVLLQPNSKVLS
jgi:hypothetical protein